MSTEPQKHIEFIEEPEQRRTLPRVGDLISGEIFREFFAQNFGLLLFGVVLIIIYIGNHYDYDKLMRKEQLLRNELKNLRSESVTTAAELMQISRQSEVLKLVTQNGLGLEESTTPPKTIK